MYAVIAPGFSSVYTNWKDVERIKALYPYPKWKKVYSAEDAAEWIQQNRYARQLDAVYNYGNTFDNFFIDVKYKIAPDCVYYILNTRRVGHVILDAKDAIVEYKGSKIYVKYPDIRLSDETIAGHMSAIYNLFNLVGEYLDINIQLEHYALYYALTMYSKSNSRVIKSVRDLMLKRSGATGISLVFNKEV